MNKFIKTLSVFTLVFVSLLTLANDPIKVTPDSISDNAIVESPDVRPQYVGGMTEFNSWFQENFEYPEELKELGLKANVVAQFVIDADGSVSDIEILHNTRKGFGVEAKVKQALNDMPKWIPGTSADANVRCRLILPIRLEYN